MADTLRQKTEERINKILDGWQNREIAEDCPALLDYMSPEDVAALSNEELENYLYMLAM